MLLAGKRMALAEFFSVAVQMAEGLAQLHDRKIIHMDIHLANVLIEVNTNEVKLTDFGLSTLIEGEIQEACSPDMIEGALAFISPERTGRMNRPIDYRSDLYSLGVCYYRMLTGQMPFSAVDPMELVHSHIARQPVAPHELDASLPIALSRLVMKLLEKKAEKRYQSAQGIVYDLMALKAAFSGGAELLDWMPGCHDVSRRFQVAQKIYGRDQEICTLHETFERVAAGSSELLLIGGYSGIGKTSLVNEVHKGLARQRGRFIAGKHDQFQRDIPFSAFIQAFRQLINQILAESEERVGYWREALLDALGSNASVIMDVIPEVEYLIGSQQPAPELGPAETQNRFIFTLQRFIGVFARQEHPLVIFLDDLQWADAPSLQLMQLLCTRSENRYLLMLGAYRDNEVSDSHPLIITLNRIRDEGIQLQTILLAPLKLGDTNNLIADTVLQPDNQTHVLSALLQEKSGGNPFFISQLLRELHDHGLFTLDMTSGRWSWDMEQLHAVGVTSNVVDLMSGKIGRLQPSSRQTLTLAACIGNRFSLNMLSTICEKSEVETTGDIWAALQEGLVLPTASGFRFLHDRVQQAAYAMIAPHELKPMHLKIGRLLLRSASSDQIEEDIFDILSHLNAAIELIDDADERFSLSMLNLQAGRKAKSSTAYEPALRHFQTALALLPRDRWQSRYADTLEIFRELTDVEYLLGHSIEAAGHIDEALAMAVDRYDQTDIYLQKITQYNQQGRYNELVDIARHALTLFGVVLPAADDAYALQQSFVRQMADYESLLGDQAIADLIGIKDVEDRDQDCIIRLMAILTDGTYIAVPTMFPHVVMEVVTRSMRHGHNTLSAVGFVWSSVIIIQEFKDYQSAYELGKLSMKLVERYPNRRIHAQVTFLYAVCTLHWVRPLVEQIAVYHQAYQHGIENGNLVFAGYARTMTSKTMLAAATVDKALEENRIGLAFYEKTGSPFLMNERFCQFFLQNLKGERTDTLSLSSPEFDEHSILELWQQPETLFGHGLAYFLTSKMQLFFLFGESRKTWEFATAHAGWMQYIPVLYETTVFSFYRALAAAALLEGSTSAEREAMTRDLHVALDEFAIWAKNCPENFAWQEQLLQGEVARLRHDMDEAHLLYARAATLADSFGHPQGIALSREMAGRLYHQQGNLDEARTCIEDASFQYYQWGAHAKVENLRLHLEELVPKSAPQTSSNIYTSSQNSTAIISSHLMDLNTVLNASLTLSSEIHLDVLLQKIMSSVIENAGAVRGFLLLPGDGDWFIVAHASVHDKQVILEKSRLTSSALVCEAIVRYVIRSRQDLVLDDASQSIDFQSSPHIVRQGTRSALCLPLLSQNRLNGVLYLENNLVAGAFISKRSQLLKMLSSQAAIAIENAMLYESLAASERKYRGVFEEASDTIFLTDAKGAIIDINPAGLVMFGFSREELLGLNLSDLCQDDEERERFRRTIEAAGEVRAYELRLRSRNGGTIDTLMTAGSRRDDQGKVIGYQGILSDISVRKETERLRAEYGRDLERQVAERTRELSEVNFKLQMLTGQC